MCNVFFSPFRATWKTEPQSCGGTLRATSHSQVLASPGYPNSYPGSLECVYVINAPSGKLITLKVKYFERLEWASTLTYPSEFTS